MNSNTPTPQYPVSALPIIKVDADHYQVERSDGTTPLTYEIPAGKGFILDVSGYEFQIPSGLNIETPNIIQILANQNDTYCIDWISSAQQYLVTAETLMPLYGSKPFAEFKAGQQIAVGIGYLRNNPASGQPEFHVLWAGLIDVR